jgi:predicted transcriptional regulator
MPRGLFRLPRLGELEQAVLEFLWTAGQADVHATHAAVGTSRGISPNTVGSTLERLFKKSLLTREKVSHSYRYTAAMDRETFHARKLVDAAGGVRALAREGLLAAFVDLVADSDREALAELERLVRAKRKERP